MKYNLTSAQHLAAETSLEADEHTTPMELEYTEMENLSFNL